MASKRRTSTPTIYDVARVCGVASSTVSRALSQPGRISAKTTERVRDAAARMGYQANPLARYLPTGRTETIVLVVSDITNPVYFPVIRGAEQTSAAAGYTLVLSDIGEAPERELEVMEKLVPTVDGFALATSRLTEATIRAVARRRPMVTMNRVTQQVPSVVPDNEQGMRHAVEHLVDLGHRALTYVAGPPASWANSVRWQSLRAAGEQLGVSVRRVGPYAPTIAGGWAAAADLVRPLPTAVVAYNDLLAIGAMQGLADLGRAVPADVSVVGCDNIVGSDWCTPALTTLAAPLRELGARGMQHLLAMIAETASPLRRPVVLPSQLIIRESTAAPRTNHP